MKILLTTLNAKFIHSALALYYLKNYCQSTCQEIKIREFTINGRSPDILGEIFLEQPSLVGFSCYIWNIEQTLEIAAMLKKVLPDTIIVLGGPEVSFDACSLMESNLSIDYIVTGEGEETFRELILCLGEGRNTGDVAGLVYRKNSVPVKNPDRLLIKNLDQIPFPYPPEDLDKFTGKIIYYESSRGCPFNCRYCLSSTSHGVRFFSLERVKKDLKLIVQAGIKQIKFVDRTFNCHQGRTKELLSFLLDLDARGINFHFEIGANLLDEEIMDLLGKAPPGYFQLEIGIQSTNPLTLHAVERTMDFARVRSAVCKIVEAGNVHLHLDLIAGLPKENLASFEKSFNDVFKLHPHNLQLGFLKVLKGSGLRKQAREYGFIHQDCPPYEILSTKDISFRDLLDLKSVEDVLERFYNSGKFRQTLLWFAGRFPQGPYSFFLQFAQFIMARKTAGTSRPDVLARELWDFSQNVIGKEELLLLKDLIKFDLMLMGKKFRLPDWLQDESSQRDLTLEFLKDREKTLSLLPHFSGMNSRKIYNTISVEKFAHTFDFAHCRIKKISDVPSYMLFDYSKVDQVLKYAQVFVISMANQKIKF
ncbi:MAG: DUF4080 domain-containing protein [Desulfitobacteriaceae bacterium]|nr:DUF4080 domain-containing protein [Desulfitobacteriaceae bacterium]